jgi:Flp pilus assembly protein TadD
MALQSINLKGNSGVLREEEQRADRLYKQGVKALEKSQLEVAVRCLRQAVQVNPYHASAWNDLGIVMEALGNPMEALRCYRTAIDRNSGHVEARSNYGMLWLNLDMANALSRHAFASSVA